MHENLPQTPISGMTLPQARRSFLLQIQQFNQERWELSKVNLLELSDEQVEKLYKKLEVQMMNLQRTEDHIDDLVEKEAGEL